LKFKQQLQSGWQRLKNFDIKPAKPVMQELFEQAEQARVSYDLSTAINCLQKIITNNCQNLMALLLLSNLNLAVGNLNSSNKFIKLGLKYYPELYNFYELQGFLYARQGNLKSSAIFYKKALQMQPDIERLQHLLNGVQEVNSIRAPRSYIVGLYNDYAEIFERSLVDSLEYRGHVELTNYMNNFINAQDSIEKVLDLGCGTGLWGQSFKNKFQIQNLLGVDLSEEMLVKARDKGIYTTLYNADLLEYLKDSIDSYDVIAASDVLIYFGELEEVLAESYNRLKPGGLFGFSVESLNTGSFKLLANGRYQHSLPYITAISTRLGFSKIYTHPIDLRKESGNIVAGYLVLLQK